MKYTYGNRTYRVKYKMDIAPYYITIYSYKNKRHMLKFLIKRLGHRGVYIVKR